MAKLVGISGVLAGREYPLADLCILGRSPNAQVRVPDLSVSRQHAKITRTADNFVLEDLDSGLGTMVNGALVNTAQLENNDEIMISISRFRFIDGPIERVKTSEFSIVFDHKQAQVVSMDAMAFSRLQPVAETMDAQTVLKLTRRLNAMLAVGRAASSNLEPKALLDEVLRHCLDVFPAAERALVAEPDRRNQSLVVSAMALREEISFGEFSLSSSISVEVLNKGRSVVSTAPENGGHAHSMMVAPLICRGHMLGLIYVDWVREGGAFAEEDLEVLTGIAIQTALALTNAQLHESLIEQSRTEQELSAAYEVQKRFMPRGVPKMPGVTFVAHYDPCRDVGGDLYDFIPLDENRIGIVVGDVSGKGFPAALVMAWVASQLRVAAHLEERPRGVLARINESLLEARQDDLFVTLFYGVLDRRTMDLYFCNAGHVTPLVRRSEPGVVDLIEEGTGLPVGMVEGARFEEGHLHLDPGDTLMLVSDGVTEAMDAQKRMFGIEGLYQAMSVGMPNATDLVSNVLAGIRHFVDGETQYDDITIVAVGTSSQMEDIRATLPPGSYPPDTLPKL